MLDLSRRQILGVAAALVLLMLLSDGAYAATDRSIVLASTTSTEQSGLFVYLLPLFTAKTGIAVRVVAVGTGQALRLGERGDADVLLVHDQVAEEKFVAAGYGVDRRAVMYNDFVLVGPKSDPAQIGVARDSIDAFARIANSEAPFISRADDSGTYRLELRLWRLARINPHTWPAGKRWYLETGTGMGAALNMAAARDAYLLVDRGTWLSFKNRRALVVLLQGDKKLFNPYSVMLVNPRRYPPVKEDLGRQFMDWLTGSEGQAAIKDYQVGGESLFFPSAQGNRYLIMLGFRTTQAKTFWKAG